MTEKRAAQGTTMQLSTRVPNELGGFFEKIAEKNERSVSWVVARALKEWAEAKGFVQKK